MARLIDQLELIFEEFESSASEDEIAVERAVAGTTNVAAFTRKRPARQPFPHICGASGWSSRRRPGRPKRLDQPGRPVINRFHRKSGEPPTTSRGSAARPLTLGRRGHRL
jgi:hypothetical protein